MTRYRTLLVVFLLATLALAGCTQKKSSTPSQDECKLEPALCDPDAYLANHPCITNNWTPRVYAPDTPGPESPATPWRQGDFWTYRLTVNGKTTNTTLVYYDDADIVNGVAQHYLVGSSEEHALDHALFSINPVLGRIHRTLYSPHESGMHSDMFYFPLCPGSNWQTSFYQAAFRMTAARQTLSLPGGASDPLGFRVTGTSADGSTLSHDYSPTAKWFTGLHLRRADGLALDLDLTAYGSGKTGMYYFYRAQRDHVMSLATAPAETTIARDGDYNRLGIYIEANRTAGNGKVEVHVRDPTGQSVACVGIAGGGISGITSCPNGPVKLHVPFARGNWTVTVETPLLDSATKAGGEVRIVSIQDRSGTV